MPMKEKLYTLILLFISSLPCNKVQAQQYGVLQWLPNYCTDSGICSSTPVMLGDMNGSFMATTSWDMDTSGIYYSYNNKGELTDTAHLNLPILTTLPVTTPHQWKPMSVILDGSLYFCSTPGFTDSMKIFRWDGKTVTQILDRVNGNIVSTSYPIAYNKKIYFTVSDIRSRTSSTYEYDPATNSSRKAFDYSTTQGIVYKDKFYYSAYHPTAGLELHSTDIKTGEQKLVGDLINGIYGSDPNYFRIIDDKLYFVGVDSTINQNLYVYNGTGDPKGLLNFGKDTTCRIFSLHYYEGKFYMICNMQIPGVTVSRFHYTYDVATGEFKEEPVLNKYYPGLAFANYKGKLAFGATVRTGSGLTGAVYIYDPAKNLIRELPIENNLHIKDAGEVMALGNALYVQITTAETGTGIYRYEEEPLVEPGVKLFPNPTYNTSTLRIGVDTAQRLNLCIYDIAGRRVMNNDLGSYKKGNYDIPVNAGNLAPGVYICILRGYRGTIFTGKLVKL